MGVRFRIGIVLALAPALLWAQEAKRGVGGLDSLLDPPLLAGKQILRFDIPEQQLGDLSEDDAPVTYRFDFRNVSEEPVVLTRVVVSCGCTEASLDKRIVEPGERGTVTLVFNPSQQAGSVYKTAFVYTALSDRRPAAKLALLGKVRPTADRWVDYPYPLGESLRMRQSAVRFRNLMRTEKRTERVVCVNSGEKPLKLSALLCPPYATFRTEPEVIAPGEEADLVVTVEGALLPDSGNDGMSFTIVVDGLPGRPSDRTLQVNVFTKETPAGS